MSTLTHSQLVARECFKNVIVDNGDVYPDDVRIVPLDGMTVDRMADLMRDHVALGTAIVFVRDDGVEFVMQRRDRMLLGGVIDRVLRRVRVELTVVDRPQLPAPRWAPARRAPRHELRYVHPDHVRDLRDLSGHLVTC